jgi:hypothetical protein
MMNSYQTRRLIALRNLRHEGQNAAPGDEVFATPVDAEYLVRMGDARHATNEQVAKAPAPAAQALAAPAPPRRRGRPSNAELASRAAAPEPASEPAADPIEIAASDPAPAGQADTDMTTDNTSALVHSSDVAASASGD